MVYSCSDAPQFVKMTGTIRDAVSNQGRGMLWAAFVRLSFLLISDYGSLISQSVKTTPTATRPFSAPESMRTT